MAEGVLDCLRPGKRRTGNVFVLYEANRKRTVGTTSVVTLDGPQLETQFFVFQMRPRIVRMPTHKVSTSFAALLATKKFFTTIWIDNQHNLLCSMTNLNLHRLSHAKVVLRVATVERGVMSGAGACSSLRRQCVCHHDGTGRLRVRIVTVG